MGQNETKEGKDMHCDLFCTMALALVVTCAARMPRGSRERKALARAARALREVV